MPSPKEEPSITLADLAKYETLMPLVESMHRDIRELSLKNQNAALSKPRIQLINRLLSDVKVLLQREPTASYLQILDEVTVPQNADALLIFGQFEAALEQFKEKYTYYDEDDEEMRWQITDHSD